MFDEESYEIWMVKMKSYLDTLDLWDVVEKDYQVSPLLQNPTSMQTIYYKKRKTMKAKAKSCLFSILQINFTQIMILKYQRKYELFEGRIC
uniref:DUF4219 domain-containing protein n=1 Tax=Cajanus cajan TaxID=3821 RepID=A0A151QV98_CAJCA|nr:hypothetical protein KK1_044846 [Cajanus cajan]